MEIKEIVGDEYLKRFSKTEEDNRKIIGETIYEYFGKKHGNIIFPLFSKYHHQKIKDAFLALEKSGKRDIKYFLGILNKLK